MLDSRVLPYAYLNGEIVPVEDATVPVLDRGFLFGDAIYEVIPAYQGKLFRTTSHVERLMQGLDKIQIRHHHSAADWTEVFAKTVRANGAVDQYVYLQVTRGVSRFRDHALPTDIRPLVFAMSQRLLPRADRILREGVSAVLIPDTRWSRCDIKSTSLLANVLLRQQAIEQDCVEAILHRDGQVTEGAASTVMLVKQGRLILAPNTNAILPGTTRRLTEELADHIDLDCETRPFDITELRAADEVLISAATKEVLPVCAIDQAPVGDGLPGPVWKRLDAAYQQYKSELLAS